MMIRNVKLSVAVSIVHLFLASAYVLATPLQAATCHAICPKFGGVTCSCPPPEAHCEAVDGEGCNAWNETTCSVSAVCQGA